jgi:hypothetical protein
LPSQEEISSVDLDVDNNYWYKWSDFSETGLAEL